MKVIPPNLEPLPNSPRSLQKIILRVQSEVISLEQVALLLGVPESSLTVTMETNQDLPNAMPDIVVRSQDTETMMLVEAKIMDMGHTNLDKLPLMTGLRQQKLQAPPFKRVRISSPPGTFLAAIADFFFSKRTRTLLLDPIIADMQQEYFIALNGDRKWKARWIQVCGWVSFWKSAGLWSLVRTVGIIWKIGG
jgi:hypothetical protein